MTDAGPANGVDVVEPTKAELAHARRVAEAKATVPHVYLERQVAGTRQGEVSTTHLVRAAATALRDFPRLNGAYRDATFELRSRINVGVAVATDAGLAYPTIHDADRKETEEIASEVAALAERARGGTITQPELSGSTFSLADLAPLGISRAELVVNRGQAAILAVGVADSSAMNLTLACDNRIVHAPDAAAFLARTAALLVP